MFKRKQKRGSGGDSVCVLSSKKEKPLAWILVWYMNQYPCSACKMIKKNQMSHYYLFALGHFEYWMGARRDGRAIQQLVVFLRLIPMGVILHSLTFCPPHCHFPRICHPFIGRHKDGKQICQSLEHGVEIAAEDKNLPEINNMSRRWGKKLSFWRTSVSGINATNGMMELEKMLTF